MSPAELRRLADRKLIEAANLEEAAERLRSQAAALRGLLDPLAPMSQRVWAGPAATDFESTARSLSQQVDEQAAQLVRAAVDFDADASQCRRQAARFREQAAAAEVATAPVGAIPAGVL